MKIIAVKVFQLKQLKRRIILSISAVQIYDYFIYIHVQCTRCKISTTRKNLLEVLWQMLEASDEIDLKPSLRACSRGRDFISVNNAFLVITFFSNM